MARKKDRKTRPKKYAGCNFLVCENVETGEIVLVPSKNCPAGFVQKAKAEMKEKGILFANEYPDTGFDFEDVTRSKRYDEKA